VYSVRLRLGHRLAKEQPADVDMVIPVPDSGVSAALGYARELNVPFELGLMRNHYVGRSFIEPTQRIRDFGVKLKLNPVPGLLTGKRVAVVDDSLVRGTTCRKIVRMLRGVGAVAVHLRITAPPTIGSCFYGIATPTTEELIAHQMSTPDICRWLQADSLAYLSLDALRQMEGPEEGQFCEACFTGNYPVEPDPARHEVQVPLFLPDG
jgi:amidophosphoribosyltransferase